MPLGHESINECWLAGKRYALQVLIVFVPEGFITNSNPEEHESLNERSISRTNVLFKIVIIIYYVSSHENWDISPVIEMSNVVYHTSKMLVLSDNARRWNLILLIGISSKYITLDSCIYFRPSRDSNERPIDAFCRHSDSPKVSHQGMLFLLTFDIEIVPFDLIINCSVHQQGESLVFLCCDPYVRRKQVRSWYTTCPQNQCDRLLCIY